VLLQYTVGEMVVLRCNAFQSAALMRALTPAERYYAQIEKSYLGMIIYVYMAGKWGNHKALESIMLKSLHLRITVMSLKLQKYKIVKYKKGNQMFLEV